MKRILIELNDVTARQRSCGKVMFSLACVCLRGYLWSQIPSWSLVPYPFRGLVGYPGGEGTGHTHPWERHGTTDMLSPPPEPQVQAVCILLECFLVLILFSLNILNLLQNIFKSSVALVSLDDAGGMCCKNVKKRNSTPFREKNIYHLKKNGAVVNGF